MASAIFVNATRDQLAINLNTELENQLLEKVPVFNSGDDPADVVVEFYGCCLPISAYPNKGVFGGNSASNVVVVFYETASEPHLFQIESSVPVTLDLYFYVMGDTLACCDQTGVSDNITVSKVEGKEAEEMLLAMSIPIHDFTATRTKRTL